MYFVKNSWWYFGNNFCIHSHIWILIWNILFPNISGFGSGINNTGFWYWVEKYSILFHFLEVTSYPYWGSSESLQDFTVHGSGCAYQGFVLVDNPVLKAGTQYFHWGKKIFWEATLDFDTVLYNSKQSGDSVQSLPKFQWYFSQR